MYGEIQHKILEHNLQPLLNNIRIMPTIAVFKLDLFSNGHFSRHSACYQPPSPPQKICYWFPTFPQWVCYRPPFRSEFVPAISLLSTVHKNTNALEIIATHKVHKCERKLRTGCQKKELLLYGGLSKKPLLLHVKFLLKYLSKSTKFTFDQKLLVRAFQPYGGCRSDFYFWLV